MSMQEIGEQVAGFAVAPTSSSDLKKKIAKMVSFNDKKSYIESAKTACAQDYNGVLSSIKVPTLLIVGELDFVTPPEATKFMQTRIQNSKMEVMKGVGHLPNRENPQEFNRFLEEFLVSIKEVKLV